MSAFSNNAITSVFRFFLCNKKQWKSEKGFFLLIVSYTLGKSLLQNLPQ